MFSQFGLTEILLVLGALILLFGAKRIPMIGRAIGQGIHGFIAEIRGTARTELPESGTPEKPQQVSPGIESGD